MVTLYLLILGACICHFTIDTIDTCISFSSDVGCKCNSMAESIIVLLSSLLSKAMVGWFVLLDIPLEMQDCVSNSMGTTYPKESGSECSLH